MDMMIMEMMIIGNDDNGNDKTSFIDLSWMNDLQLYKKIASEVLLFELL